MVPRFPWTESGGANAALARGDLGTFAVKRQSTQALAWSAAGAGGAVALAAGLWLRLGGREPPIAIEFEPRVARLTLAF